jgi:short-subunit dehydrogenase
MGAIDLRNKPIAITGASSGIGAATAIACAAAGMPVALGARREDKLRDIVARITASGGKAIAVPMDVCSDADNLRLIDQCRQAFGSIYSVYANAGYGEEKAIHESSDAQIRAMFETNFFGTLSTIRAAMPHLLANPPGPTGVRGHVLICSSCLGKCSLPFGSTYSATKAAQNHISRAMNIELWNQGVRVSSVHPIGTRTEFFDVAAKRSGGQQSSLKTPPLLMQDASVVATKTLACLRRPRPEVWTGPRGAFVRMSMALGTMFPGTMDVILRGMAAKNVR